MRGRDVGIGTDTIHSKSQGTETERGRTVAVGTNSIPSDASVEVQDSVPGNMVDGVEIMDNAQSVIPYDRTQSHYAERDFRLKYSRPEREWRLNPIYNLIKRPMNRYANYVEAEDVHPRSISYDGNPHSISYQDYNNYDQIECPDCEEVFHSNKALRRHIPTCKPTLYACNVCGKNLQSRNSLSTHVRAMHQTRNDIRKIEQKR